ncbi:phosphatidylserine decarboxylase [Anaerohalosphaera lusitana]|uniref:Phosphatidylserine decarboxylase proenzyme n=1 Tax=Anaerohalosphaera lusitana TaxID=1936003 RepID=A0A1U9NG07_9BACT|nr:phosphatidylserine decarboxylase [Anaerohalosphaera lusitana]AQT66871.1 phosphatidylserine decarboxylase [Anaerohalosphaera lusitana]
MKIPLTKYGMPQVAVFPGLVVAAMLTIAIGGHYDVIRPGWVRGSEIVLAAVLVWVLAFFRDPERNVPADESLLLSPADGRISDITEVDEPALGGTAIRIGIFLNIFNVHINRAPCSVRIGKITYKEGEFKNACDPESARVNESNALEMQRTAQPADKLIVRQISGAIARRIVCATAEGDELTQGRRFGMIKFGSRTELYLPARENASVQVQVGDKVKAGLTVLVKYE